MPRIATTTFSDKKLPIDENSDGMIDYYQPHIISSSDYAPFGAQLAERSFFSETYPNSFNDKRDDPELGDWQDYGMRMYSTWQRRFPTPDPLIVYGQEYPELSTYQFASNSPIVAIDLDGLEGFSYYETANVFGLEVPIRRVFEIDVHVAIGTGQYSVDDIPGISQDFEKEYNSGNFYDKVNGMNVPVVFKFNILMFDSDNISPSQYADNLRKDKKNIIQTNVGSAQRGYVLNIGDVGENLGLTIRNLVTMSDAHKNNSHTKAHEKAHVFLNNDLTMTQNPETPSEHNKAGGIFTYLTRIIETGEIKQNIESLNQSNVNRFNSAVPKAESQSTGVNLRTIESVKGL